MMNLLYGIFINLIDYTFYLPIDTSRNAKKFIKLINPIISIFIKSEIWPNYISELNSKASKNYLVEAILVNYIKDIFWVIAPHDVSNNNIERIKNMFDHQVCVFSDDLNKPHDVSGGIR